MAVAKLRSRPGEQRRALERERHVVRDAEEVSDRRREPAGIDDATG